MEELQRLEEQQREELAIKGQLSLEEMLGSPRKELVQEAQRELPQLLRERTELETKMKELYRKQGELNKKIAGLNDEKKSLELVAQGEEQAEQAKSALSNV